MKQSFSTSVGRVEVLVDEQSRVVSAYRFDTEGRPVAAALESWDYTDLADLLARQAGVPAVEANDIALAVTEELGGQGDEELDDFAEDIPTTVPMWVWVMGALGVLFPLSVVVWATLHAIS
jgi:hypothetical protein